MRTAIHMKIKPISTNSIWIGKRWKSKAAKEFERNIALLLATQCRDTSLPDGELTVRLRIGTTRRFDVDNSLKLLLDCLARHFGIDDRRFSALAVVRVPVKRGAEFITFHISKFRPEDFTLLVRQN